MTPGDDMTEAAKFIEELARREMEEDRSGAVVLYALARRLRGHAKQKELKECQDTLRKAMDRVVACQNLIVNAGLQLPPSSPQAPARMPTPPPATVGV